MDNVEMQCIHASLFNKKITYSLRISAQIQIQIQIPDKVIERL